MYDKYPDGEGELLTWIDVTNNGNFHQFPQNWDEIKNQQFDYYGLVNKGFKQPTLETVLYVAYMLDVKIVVLCLDGGNFRHLTENNGETAELENEGSGCPRVHIYNKHADNGLGAILLKEGGHYDAVDITGLINTTTLTTQADNPPVGSDHEQYNGQWETHGRVEYFNRNDSEDSDSEDNEDSQKLAQRTDYPSILGEQLRQLISRPSVRNAVALATVGVGLTSWLATQFT
jgi:hypothetical protein